MDESVDEWESLRIKARKELAGKMQWEESMLETRPASRWITPPAQRRPRAELYGRLWREGEVAVLFGEKGVGKSLFAVQLAEDIARGTRTLLTLPPAAATPPNALKTHRPKPKRQRPKVLLIDFELSTQQFTERYLIPPPFPGMLPTRPRFKFQRAALNWDGQVPDVWRGNVEKFLTHSIGAAIDRSRARVVIIDSLAHFPRRVATATGCLSVMRTLKHWAARHNLSILLIAQTQRSSKRANGIANSALRTPHSALASIADSVFALNPSTFNPEFRYIKHLASRSTPIDPNADVLTYQLNSQNPHSALRSPHSEGPSLGLHFLGPSTEQDHLRDYAAEVLAATHAHEAELKRLHRRSSRDILVDGILDGRYGRYLKGK